MGTMGVQIHIFFTSAKDGDESSNSLPGCLIPKEEPQYPPDRRLRGPQSCGEGKNPVPTGTSTPAPASSAV
jgi:hypothetical protein